MGLEERLEEAEGEGRAEGVRRLHGGIEHDACATRYAPGMCVPPTSVGELKAPRRHASAPAETSGKVEIPHHRE